MFVIHYSFAKKSMSFKWLIMGSLEPSKVEKFSALKAVLESCNVDLPKLLSFKAFMSLRICSFLSIISSIEGSGSS